MAKPQKRRAIAKEAKEDEKDHLSVGAHGAPHAVMVNAMTRSFFDFWAMAFNPLSYVIHFDSK